MTNEEWNEMQRRWLESNKMKDFHEKRKEQKMKSELRMNKDELLSVIDSLMEYHNQPIKDKEVSDWLLFDKSKQDVINNHYSSSIKWNYYLKIYEVLEDFEMCILIRDLIFNETFECKRFCAAYYAYSDFDDQTIDDNVIKARAFIEEHYQKNLKKNGK